MAENIQIGMRPSGEDGVRASFLTLEEHANKVTLRFKEATKATRETGKAIQEDVGQKGGRAVEETKNKTETLGKSAGALAGVFAKVFSVAMLTRFLDKLREIDKQMAETSSSISRSLVGTAFASGDLSNLSGIRSGIVGMDSPLGIEERVGVFGSVRDAAPLADQRSVMRVTERLATTGAVAAGMNPQNITRLAEMSGELIARGFSPDEATDMATTILQMGGNQNLGTRVFGIAEQVGLSMGAQGGRQATMAGLPYLLAGHRQGLELPQGQNLDAFMSQVNPGMVGQFQRGLAGSRGALDRAAGLATGDGNYSLSVSMAANQAGTVAADELSRRSRRALSDQEFLERRSRMDAESGDVSSRMSRVYESLGGRYLTEMAMGAGNMMEDLVGGPSTPGPTRMEQQVRIRVESDDPSTRLAGSGD